MQNPCLGCKERILPTKEHPVTCHGKCERERTYQEAERKKKEFLRAQRDQEMQVQMVWEGKRKRIKKSKR